MPLCNTLQIIQKEIIGINKRLYDAGFSFLVYSIDSYSVYVQSSFDFGYYVNLHIEFNGYFFTNLMEGEKWPCSWGADQIFILDDGEINQILSWHDVEIPQTQSLFGFIFNINGKNDLNFRNIDSKGIVICKELNVRWEHL